MAFNDKKLVYALRHNPQQFGLELDQEGWTDIWLADHIPPDYIT